MRQYFRNIYIAIWTILVGMALTLKHLFTRSVTLQYPDEKWQLPPGARAQLFNNIDDCIGCNACANACPVDCIYIETIKALPGEDLGEASDGHKKRLHVVRFDIDMSKCCYCAFCTYPCPTECLIMTTNYENAVYHRDN
ncbi:MAG: NADH-quinone oxidoreductase subunit I, partial [Nitrospinota bacterium]